MVDGRSPRLPPRRSTWTRGPVRPRLARWCGAIQSVEVDAACDLGAARFAAVAVTIAVGHDAQQPRAACGIVAQFDHRKSLKCLNIGIVHQILSVGGLRTQATRSPMKRGEEWSRLPLESLAQPPIAQHEFRGHRSLPCAETHRAARTCCANSFALHLLPADHNLATHIDVDRAGELVCPGRHILRNPHRV
jgi:hypothetical protein